MFALTPALAAPATLDGFRLAGSVLDSMGEIAALDRVAAPLRAKFDELLAAQ